MVGISITYFLDQGNSNYFPLNVSFDFAQHYIYFTFLAVKYKYRQVETMAERTWP